MISWNQTSGTLVLFHLEFVIAHESYLPSLLLTHLSCLLRWRIQGSFQDITNLKDAIIKTHFDWDLAFDGDFNLVLAHLAGY